MIFPSSKDYVASKKNSIINLAKHPIDLRKGWQKESVVDSLSATARDKSTYFHGECLVLAVYNQWVGQRW